jgi:hypothetical protein
MRAQAEACANPGWKYQQMERPDSHRWLMRAYKRDGKHMQAGKSKMCELYNLINELYNLYCLQNGNLCFAKYSPLLTFL